MIVLATDTCFARCAACLYDSSKLRVLSSEDHEMERGHAEALAPMVQRLLTKTNMLASQIDRIAVTTGPGSFTGLRIGLSFARALGSALSIPVLGLDTLKAVRLGVGKNQSALIAHKAGQSGCFYVSDSHISANIEILKLEDLRPFLYPKHQLVLGSGAPDIESHFKDLELKCESTLDLPNLAKLAQFAAEQVPPDGLPAPIYVREPDAKPQNPGTLCLRNAVPSDAVNLSKLHQSCFEHGWSSQNLIEMLAVQGTTALLVEQNSTPLAFIILRQMFDEAEILTIATAPQARRHGHAQALIEAALAQGLSKLHLEVAASNHPAQALYAKNGFKKSGLRKAYYARPSGPAEDAVLMVWQPS